MENKTISQSNVLTESRIEYTALERNIFYMVLGALKAEQQRYYYISVKEIQEKTGTTNVYEEYKKATERLTSVVYSFKRPENGNLLQVSLFASCEYMDGTGMIEIELSEKIQPYLYDLKKNFTMYQLEIALTLKSKYAKRLYEILSQWSSVGERTFELLELKRMLDLYDPKTKIEEYSTNFTEFKIKVLDIAQKEFRKTNSNIQFTYKANKFGRKYTSITFKITTLSFQKKIDFQDEDSEMIGKLVNKYKLRRDQAIKVLELNELKFINDKLYTIMVKNANKEITNIGAFTAKTFGV